MRNIRELIDTHHTLPSVELKSVRIQEGESIAREDMKIIVANEEVGQCTIVNEFDIRGGISHFDGVEIIEDKRGFGIGIATYLLAIEMAHSHGLVFETQDYDQTADSRRVWERLARLSVAEVIEPFQRSQIRQDRFVGKFRVPITKA